MAGRNNEQQSADSVRLQRLRWRSRRGLLELELLLAPFNDHRLWLLPESLLEEYEVLLDCDDIDVHEWLMRRAEIPGGVERIVKEIRAFMQPSTF